MLDTNYIETLLKGMDGLEFQKYCVNFLRKKYGGAFQEVAAMGPLGDGGKDGYVFETREYFAISSWSRNIAFKINSDFKNCMDKNLEVKKFIFVTNRKIGPKECDIMDKIRLEYADIKIETFSHRDIAIELIKFPEREVMAILGKQVPFFDDRTIYFEECMEKQITFTLWDSIKDSMHLYLSSTVFIAIFCVLFFFVESDWAKTLCFVLIACLMLLYMHYNIESLRNYKYAHKILYFLFSDKFRLRDEVILDEETHITVRRNSAWNYTINKRSIDCIKRGCNSKVFIYTNEDGSLIGRCDKDKINHIYRVDNNFYGEVL